MKTLEFVLFDGISPLSKAIKFFTRSNFSHAAVHLGSGELIEAWGTLAGVWWDYSFIETHTPGTRYELWGLEVPNKAYDLAVEFYRFLAERKFPYNYLGVIGFVLPFFTSNGGFFCSEGCWEGLVFAGVAPKDIPGWKVSPDRFRDQLQLLGAEKIGEGVV